MEVVVLLYLFVVVIAFGAAILALVAAIRSVFVSNRMKSLGQSMGDWNAWADRITQRVIELERRAGVNARLPAELVTEKPAV
jgi:hypothetical protein